MSTQPIPNNLLDTPYKLSVAPVQLTKIAAGDKSTWHAFNGSFCNSELNQMQVAETLYAGHPITTWLDPAWRKTKNYKLGQHLGLDFDTGDQKSTIAHLQHEPFISKYGAIVYTTPSHRPESPRARVIFLLDTPIRQAKNYALAMQALLWLFGTADRQCKDPTRFFYGGRPGACEMEWPANVLPLELVKDLIARYRATGHRERKRRNTQYQPQNTDETEVVAALKAIDAWGIQYDQWLAILMAIHSAFPGANGLRIAEDWADGKPGEVKDKWKGFRSGGNDNGQITVGTLFAMATRNGWQRSL